MEFLFRFRLEPTRTDQINCQIRSDRNSIGNKKYNLTQSGAFWQVLTRSDTSDQSWEKSGQKPTSYKSRCERMIFFVLHSMISLFLFDHAWSIKFMHAFFVYITWILYTIRFSRDAACCGDRPFLTTIRQLADASRRVPPDIRPAVRQTVIRHYPISVLLSLSPSLIDSSSKMPAFGSLGFDWILNYLLLLLNKGFIF